MSQHGLWAEIVKRGYVETADGRRLPLHSATSFEQCEFIQQQMQSVGAVKTLEIGLAYGISALAICQKLQGTIGGRHIAIDPWQKTECWHSVGLENLRRAGFETLVDFFDESAEQCLPKLVAAGVCLDFAYIDAGKRLDDTLIYSSYVMRMLRVGGRVVFDDAQFPGIRAALRYLVQDPRYRCVAILNPDGRSRGRDFAERLARCLPNARKLAAPQLVVSDQELGIAANCVVLEKVADTEADWKWHPCV